MDLDALIITWFCVIDEGLQALLAGKRLRERGPEPTLAASEVLTMEVSGAYLGLEQDAALRASFRRHSRDFFPALARVHRTPFGRQAAHLHAMKDRLWQWLRHRIPHDPHLALVESVARPVCQFTRARRCRRFRGAAASGHDHLSHRPFYGFRLPARVCWLGVLCQIELPPGSNGQELAAAAADLPEGTSGLLSGDRTCWAPRRREQLALQGVQRLAPLRRRKHDPWPRLSRTLSRWRYRIDTHFGQLAERTTLKRIWAPDLWHLTSRLLRTVLMHTLAVFTNIQLERPPVRLADLVA